MAKQDLTAISKVRPARDPAAPWASNAAQQRREADMNRAVVYCVYVEGLSLLKIGQTTQLKSRLTGLRSDVRRQVHIAYWAEFRADDAKDIERCALLRLRRHYDSEGEWSLADPACGASAIKAAAEFMGVRPMFEAGAPSEVEPDDEIQELRENRMPQKQDHMGRAGREYWSDPSPLKVVDAHSKAV